VRTYKIVSGDGLVEGAAVMPRGKSRSVGVEGESYVGIFVIGFGAVFDEFGRDFGYRVVNYSLSWVTHSWWDVWLWGFGFLWQLGCC